MKKLLAYLSNALAFGLIASLLPESTEYILGYTTALIIAGGSILGGAGGALASPDPAEPESAEDQLRDLLTPYGLTQLRDQVQAALGQPAPYFLDSPEFADRRRLVAKFSPAEKALINAIVATGSSPNAQNIAAQDLLRNTLQGDYLPIQGNPYAQPLLDALGRESQRAVDITGPAFMRNLQGVLGGSLSGAGSAAEPIDQFYGGLTERAADRQLMALSNLYNFERGNMMNALQLAPAIGDLETQRLMSLLPVAGMKRQRRDEMILRAIGLFDRRTGLDFANNQQYFNALVGGGGATPSNVPSTNIGAGALGSGIGQLTGQLLANRRQQQVMASLGLNNNNIVGGADLSPAYFGASDIFSSPLDFGGSTGFAGNDVAGGLGSIFTSPINWGGSYGGDPAALGAAGGFSGTSSLADMFYGAGGGGSAGLDSLLTATSF
jgi:hypothetical protein